VAHTVAVYIRESGNRNYTPAKAIHYGIGTTFCIRFKQGEKRETIVMESGPRRISEDTAIRTSRSYLAQL